MTGQAQNTRHKALQRKRDRALGWREVTLKVAAEHVAELRRYAANLPGPRPVQDARQLDLIARIEAELAGDEVDPGQAKLL